MEVFLLTAGLLLIGFMGIAIRIWVADKEFKGTCASQSPFLNKEKESCSLCGKSPEEFSQCDGSK